MGWVEPGLQANGRNYIILVYFISLYLREKYTPSLKNRGTNDKGVWSQSLEELLQPCFAKN